MKKSTKGKDRAPLAIIILLSTIVCLCVFGLGMWCDRNVELLSELFSKLLFEQSYERVKGIYLLIREKRVDFLVSHISMTFITISVMSVLSENNLIIYWENLIKERLINPPFGCFSSLTIYAFYTMLFGFISFFADSTTGVFSFFVLDVIILTVLSSNMISVYYGRDKRKEKLEKEFCHAEKDTKRINLDKMQAYTIAAFENREYDKLMENCYFYAKYTDINELRFMFGYILSKEKINAYECNVIEKIYEGLLENFGNRLESYDDWEVENIPDIYKSVIPVHNSYIRVLYDKYLYDERIDYGADFFSCTRKEYLEDMGAAIGKEKWTFTDLEEDTEYLIVAATVNMMTGKIAVRKPFKSEVFRTTVLIESNAGIEFVIDKYYDGTELAELDPVQFSKCKGMVMVPYKIVPNADAVHWRTTFTYGEFASWAERDDILFELDYKCDEDKTQGFAVVKYDQTVSFIGIAVNDEGYTGPFALYEFTAKKGGASPAQEFIDSLK